MLVKGLGGVDHQSGHSLRGRHPRLSSIQNKQQVRLGLEKFYTKAADYCSYCYKGRSCAETVMVLTHLYLEVTSLSKIGLYPRWIEFILGNSNSKFCRQVLK